MRPSAVISLAVCAAALAACAPKPLILKGPRFDARAPLDEVMAAAGKDDAAGQAPVANRSAPILLGQSANADWPQRMGGPTHALPPLALRDNLALAWAAPIGKPDDKRHQITAVPVVAGGRIYTIDSRSTVTATSTGGQTLWQVDLTPPGLSPDVATAGGLAFGAGHLYVSTGFGALQALDPATGRVVWTQKFNAAVSGTPTVDGNVVYVITKNSSAWALDAATGKIRWQQTGTQTAKGVPGAAGPAVGGRFVLLPFPSGQLAGVLRPGGAQVWSTTVAGERLGQGYSAITDITGDPVVVGDKVYAGNATGGLIALDLNTGSVVWRANEGVVNPVWVAGGSVFLVSDQNRLMRLDAGSGEHIWSVKLPYYVPVKKEKNRRDIFAAYGPILAGGRVWVASADGQLTSFDPASGAQLSAVAMGAGAASEPVVAGGVLYAVTEDGQLRAFR